MTREWNDELQYTHLYEWVDIYQELLKIMILDADDPQITKQDILMFVHKLQRKVHDIVITMDVPDKPDSEAL